MLTRLALKLALLLPLTLAGCCCMDRVYNPGCCDNGPSMGGCDSCSDCGRHRGQTPGHQLRKCLTCNSGCGEVYWGEWMSDPPDCCDPCDNHGNWTGDGCCSSGFWDQLCAGAPGLWGWRCGNDACQSCGGSGCGGCGSDGISDYEMYDHAPSQTVIRNDKPKPATKAKEPTPSNVEPENIEGTKTEQMPDLPPKPMPMGEPQTLHRGTNRNTAQQRSIQPTRTSAYRNPATRYASSRERGM